MRSRSSRLLMVPLLTGLALVLAGIGSVAMAQSPFTAGEDYVELSSPVSVTDTPEGQVSVVEWMWHGCPHCYDFEPHIASWLEKAPDGAHFVRKPAVPSQGWVPTALAYLYAKQENVGEEIHKALFERIHEDGKSPQNLAWMVALFEDHGLGQGFRGFLKNKAAAQEQLGQLQEQQKGHGVNAVPTVVVDGRYKVTQELAGGYGRMVEIIDYLVFRQLQGAEGEES